MGAAIEVFPDSPADRGRPRPVRPGEDHQRPAGAALRRLRPRLRLRARPGRGRGPVRRSGRRDLQAGRRVRQALPRGRALDEEGALAHRRRRLDLRRARPGSRRRRARRPTSAERIPAGTVLDGRLGVADRSRALLGRGAPRPGPPGDPRRWRPSTFSRCSRRSGWPAPRTSSRPMSLPASTTRRWTGTPSAAPTWPAPAPTSRCCCRSSARSAPARPGRSRWRQATPPRS